MQADSWISLVSAAVALPAAAVAVWQAREARRQAKAAEDQVREARRSAEAAEDQAAAAKDQVEIMRRQEEAYQAERDERDAPMFSCTSKGRAGSICKIVIRMDSGPQEVIIRILEIRVRPEGHDPTDTGLQLPDDNHQYRVVPGGDFSVDVDLRADRDSVRVEFWLDRMHRTERAGPLVDPSRVRPGCSTTRTASIGVMSQPAIRTRSRLWRAVPVEHW